METWIEFLDFFFRSNERQQQQLSLKSDAALGSALSDHQLELSHIFLYPIKSCGAISVSRWPLDSICSSPSVASNIPNLPANPLPSSRGLLYDRHWMLVDEKGIGLSQKKFPQMCLIQPCIRLDLVPPVMEVRISNDTSYEPLIIAIVEEEEAEAVYHSRIEASVCGDRVKASLINDASISNWFSRFLGIPCRLVRKLTDRPQKPILGSSNADNTLAASLTTVSSFANESSFLLVTIPSINQLCSWQKSEEMPTSSFFSSDFISDAIARFRPNLVAVSASESLTAFEEDSWQGRNIRIASHLFKVKKKRQREEERL